MRRKRRHAQIVMILLALLLLSSWAVFASSGGPYELSWLTMDSGGVMFAASGDYGLSGTIGQPDANTAGSGDYAVVGGFWGAGVADYRLHLPLILDS